MASIEKFNSNNSQSNNTTSDSKRILNNKL